MWINGTLEVVNKMPQKDTKKGIPPEGGNRLRGALC